jgi:tRNA synthetase class II core domain (G, H, P, S and T)
MTAASPATRTDRLGEVGLTWHDSGQVSLQGPLLALLRDCDRAFLAFAAAWGAVDEVHPALIPAAALDRVGYLDSFPHLANFAVALDAGDANLEAFRAGEPVDPDGQVRLTRLAPVRELLTPAACYHLYPQHEGEELGPVRYLTTRNTCFRRETHYQPLRRQRSFQMRELVCLGAREQVVAFLDRARTLTDRLLRALGLPVTWEIAHDPFFRPAENPQRLFQQVHATKQEAVYGGDLAVASVNLHEDHFGAAFSITSTGATASSGCVAFGLERWLFALTDRYGPHPASWPDVRAAARHALDEAAAP